MVWRRSQLDFICVGASDEIVGDVFEKMVMKRKIDIGIRIEEIRVSLGLSLGLSNRMVRMIETGKMM